MPNKGKLANQTCIVTGGSSGIGRAITVAIGKAAANVIVNYHGDESDYITGTSIFVDGGMTCYPGFTDNG